MQTKVDFSYKEGNIEVDAFYNTQNLIVHVDCMEVVLIFRVEQAEVLIDAMTRALVEFYQGDVYSHPTWDSPEEKEIEKYSPLLPESTLKTPEEYIKKHQE